eukprot:23185-Chlamydomonas_euryale.AAC.1
MGGLDGHIVVGRVHTQSNVERGEGGGKVRTRGMRKRLLDGARQAQQQIRLPSSVPLSSSCGTAYSGASSAIGATMSSCSSRVSPPLRATFRSTCQEGARGQEGETSGSEQHGRVDGVECCAAL